MSNQVKMYLVAMVVFGVLACIPPGSLWFAAASALFGVLALGQNFSDKGGFA